jgi:hypothetical protein
VDETRRATAGPDRNIVALDQSGPKPSTDSVEQDPAARDPTTHDEHVELLRGEGFEILSAGFRTRGLPGQGRVRTRREGGILGTQGELPPQVLDASYGPQARPQE